MKTAWACAWLAWQLALAVPLWSDVCTQESVRSLPFCNSSISIDLRVADYIERIPTESMIPMMNHKAEGFEPLHIPVYQWWSEGLHGPMEGCVVYEDQCACPTNFPCPSALGNAFNTTLYSAIGEAIGLEGRAISNLRRHDWDIGDGLTYWSPTLNMQRDPRWGRNQEVPGEDPYLTSQYVTAFVKSIQGESSRLRVAAACKHFVANSLENWGNFTRHNFDAHVSKEDLFDYYFPPFRECVKEAAGVMCSYNALNGEPACMNQWLLKDILRHEWDFQGYVVSDCGALDDIVNGHHSAIDAIQASALAINASVDLNCGDGGYYPKGLLEAFREKWVEESTIRNAFARLAKIQFRLGLFDPKNYYPDQDIAIIGSHNELALNAAQQSVVLLKNEGRLLPLEPNQKLALIGPHVNATEALLGNYHGDRCGCSGDSSNACIQTPLEAIEALNLQQVRSIKGCDISGAGVNEIDQAVEAAQEADTVVLIVGLDQSQEREGLDRNETTLPGLQPRLFDSVLEVASEKTVLVVFHGGSVSLGEYVLDTASAILSMPYAGQAASKALASVLYGDYNPTGKLSATMYPPSFVQTVPLTDMGMRARAGYPGRTHIYYNGPVEFPFGHGLSYSDWHLETAGWQFSPVLGKSDRKWDLSVHVTVSNIGSVGGSQTILLFWRPKKNSTQIREKLVAFEGTGYLLPGQEEVIRFRIRDNDLIVWDETKLSNSDYVLVARSSSTELTMTLRPPNFETSQSSEEIKSSRQ